MVLGAAALVTILFAYAQDWAANVLIGLAADGSITAGYILCAAMLGSAILRNSGLSPAPASLALASAAGLGLGLYSTIALLLGLAGWLNRFTACSLLLVSVLLFLADRLRRREAPLLARDIGGFLRHRGLSHLLWLIAVPSLGIGLLGASILPGMLWKPHDPHPYDVTAYHLQVPREWFEAGRIFPLEHNIYSYFPFNTEMHYLLGMHLAGGPWQGMYVAQLMSLGMMILAVAALRALAGRAAGILLATVPWTAMLGCVAYNESALIFYLCLALGWIGTREDRAAGPPAPDTTGPPVGTPWPQDPRSRRCLPRFALAGLFAGFACGVKYTAVPTILLALPLVHLLAHRSPIAVRLLRIGVFFLAGLLAFCPWLVRNYAWSGNPVFPMAMKTLGQNRLSDTQVERWDRAHRAPPEFQSLPGRLRALWNNLLADARFAYLLLPASLVLSACLWRRAEMRFLGLFLLFQLMFWLFFTHLQPRFGVIMLPIAALIVARSLAGFAPIEASVAVLCAAAGLTVLHGRFAPFNETGQQGFYRLMDLSVLNPDDLARALEKPNAKLALIGNAQAFLHQVEMSRLRYRIIFNIDFSPGISSVDAWLGQDIASLRRQGYIVIIHPDELRRLSQTYHGVPPPPPQFQSGDEPVILMPQ